jgi:hypothetical protein
MSRVCAEAPNAVGVRCRFIDDTVLLNLAAKYGYTAKPIPLNAPLLPSKNYR